MRKRENVRLQKADLLAIAKTAVEDNQARQIKAIIACRPILEDTIPELLRLAVNHNRPAVVKAILDARPQLVDEKGCVGGTPLISQQTGIGVVRVLLSRFPKAVHTFDKGRSLLCYAVIWNRLDLAALCLAHGADPKAGGGRSPFVAALTQHTVNPLMLALLIDYYVLPPEKLLALSTVPATALLYANTRKIALFQTQQQALQGAHEATIVKDKQFLEKLIAERAMDDMKPLCRQLPWLRQAMRQTPLGALHSDLQAIIFSHVADNPASATPGLLRELKIVGQNTEEKEAPLPKENAVKKAIEKYQPRSDNGLCRLSNRITALLEKKSQGMGL